MLLTQPHYGSEMEPGLSPEHRWETLGDVPCLLTCPLPPPTALTNALGHYRTFIVGGGRTYVPGDVSNDLPFGQQGDAEAVVPVSPTEEQLPIRRHGQRAGAEVCAGGEGALQETLGPGGEGHGMVGEPRVGWWHLRGPSLGTTCPTHFALETVGSLVKLK